MNPRAVAISVLARVSATDAYLAPVLDAHLSEHDLSDPRDASLITELCYGATRRQLTLDYAISQFADRRLDQMEDRVAAALRIGAYQLFYLRIPRPAVVAETVGAIKAIGLGRAAGFINALLRKLANLESNPLPPTDDEALYLSVRESHPQWLVSRWLRQLGREQAEALLKADNQPPSLVLRVNFAVTRRDEVLQAFSRAGIEALPTQSSPQGIALLGAGNPRDLPGYAQGWWQVQDEAAQLVGCFADIPGGARVLDVCAGPGGKACHLAERLEVVAADIHPVKLSKLRAEAERLQVSHRIQTEVHDATGPIPNGWPTFQAVLIDAPCSGLGTLRRHPELRYRRKEEDIDRLAELQRQMLESSQARVAPGGLLIYSVCSLEPREGIEEVESFLSAHPNFAPEPSQLPPSLLWRGFLRTLPGPEGWDGFFAARLRRNH